MSKFDNIKTTANVAIITVTDGVPTTELKSVAIPYTRKTEKAAEFARKALELDETATVAVVSIEHEKPEKVNYSLTKIADNAYYITSDYEEALEMQKDSDGLVRLFEIPFYTYTAQIWSVDGVGNYYTNNYECTGRTPYTKANLRGFIVDKYQQETRETVLGIHKAKREEGGKEYALIDADKLEICKREKREKVEAS